MKVPQFSGFAAALGVFISVSSGCATILTSKTQDIRLRAYPEDAVVQVDGKPAVATNAVLPLTRSEPHSIEVSRDGFSAKRIAVKQGLNPWFFANILFGPFFFVGMIVDGVTGQVNELEPAEITVNLDAERSPSVASRADAGTPDPGAGPRAATPAGGTKMPRDDEDALRAAASGLGKEIRDAPLPKTMAAGQQRGWIIAVMTTVSSGKTPFDRHMLSAVTDQLRVFLAERGARVVDRTAQEAAIKRLIDEEKKRSYASCVDASCQIPLGKALAASHILRSTVAKFGKACATNGELVDLRTEVTASAAYAKSDCSEEALLYAAESLAEQIIKASAANP